MRNLAKLSGYLTEISKGYPPWVPFAVCPKARKRVSDGDSGTMGSISEVRDLL